jgi:5'-3' exonuclease
MGVKDFMPFVRDSGTATNTRLQDLIRKYPCKDWIGIDMSILLISAIKSSPNFIDLLFAIPHRPIDGLNDKICSSLSVYVNNGFTVACVFDGTAHQLKIDQAYVSRYGKNEELQLELEELYKQTLFSSAEEENINIAKVKAIRRTLATFNRPDLLHSLTKAIKTQFDNKAICIGAPFEADHQLAAMYNQGIIDYVFSNDSDLSVLGSDVIYNTKVTGECWLMTNDELLMKRLPDKIKINDRTLSKDVLKHCACFLGNDFIERNCGNSPSKLKSFIEKISNADGSLKSEEAIFEYIYLTVLTPTNCSREQKASWDEVKKKMHIKKWKESMEMFDHGPAFVVESNDASLSLRNAIKHDSFSVTLGSMSGENVEWMLKVRNGSEVIEQSPKWWRTESDVIYNRTMLVGFDPYNDLRDALALRPEFANNQHDDTVFTSLLLKLFKVEVWSKKGVDICALPDPTDAKGRDLFHGSIIDFEKCPVRYHSRNELEFWLQCRQIKAPQNAAEINSLVQIVWSQLGSILKPIAKELMKGASGYCSPEVLQIKANCEQIDYKEKEEFLTVLKDKFPAFDDQTFSELFGKRNGTRVRALKHVQGGSFDINQLKLTRDLVHKDDPDVELLVICAACAPSQKLKEDNKAHFYDMLLVIELNESGEFMRFLPHPCTNCKCPNGCILCGHLAALLLVCIVLCNYDKDSNDAESTSFAMIRSQFPVPVNDLLTRPLMASHAFPSNGSERKKKQRSYRKKQGKNKKKGWQGTTTQQSPENTAELLRAGDTALESEANSMVEQHRTEQGFTLGDEHSDLLEYAIEGIIDATDEPSLEVVSKTLEWIRDIRNGRDKNGAELKSLDTIEQALRDDAEYKCSKIYMAKKIKVHEEFAKLCEGFEFRKMKNGEDDVQDTEIEMEVDADGTILNVDKGSKEDNAHNGLFPEPIVLPVIKATEGKRNAKKIELALEYDFDQIPINVLAKDIDKNTILVNESTD